MFYKKAIISIIFSIIFLFPLYLVFINSLKFEQDILDNFAALPSLLTFSNYESIFLKSDQLLAKSLNNSLIFTSLSIVFVLTWLLVKKQPMGFGDLQLIIILGMWLGPVKILLTIFFASILGILYWALLFALKKQNKNVKLPFGTFLCCAGIIMYLIPVWNPYS